MEVKVAGACNDGREHPGSIRAIVNHSGYDFFNPEVPSFAMSRRILGDSADATHAAPEAVARTVNTSPEMRATFELMKADHDDAQGSDRWKTLITETFDRYTQSPGYTFADLRTTAVPTLVLTGDRDEYCSVEDGVTAYRALPHGELAGLPNHGHYITPAAVQVVLEFFYTVVIDN